MDAFPLADLLRRIRRLADCSQRELAERIGASGAAVAAAENSTRDLPVSALARAAACAGARLVVVGPDGDELSPMDPDGARDAGGRRFPAHLDTRHGDDRWWGGPHRPRTRQPRYTFDVDRALRDRRRGEAAPADHHVPQPGDSLAERAAARREEALERAAEARRRRLLDHPPDPVLDPFTCTCPAECDDPEVIEEEVPHVDTCTCRCDLH